MNYKQREGLAKLAYDLVKVPLVTCSFGALVSGQDEVGSYIFFGTAFALLFAYIGFRLDEKQESH